MKKKFKVNFNRVDFVCIHDVNFDVAFEEKVDDFLLIATKRDYYFNSKTQKVAFKTLKDEFKTYLVLNGNALFGNYIKNEDELKNLTNLVMEDKERIINMFKKKFNIEKETEKVAEYQKRRRENEANRERKNKERQEKIEKENRERKEKIKSLYEKILRNEEIVVDSREFIDICELAGITIPLRSKGSLLKNVTNIHIKNYAIDRYSIIRGTSCNSVLKIRFK